ncbi:MAG: hypothetical protein WCD70_06755 [Alphaproteobacteria bacterium]
MSKDNLYADLLEIQKGNLEPVARRLNQFHDYAVAVASSPVAVLPRKSIAPKPKQPRND